MILLQQLGTSYPHFTFLSLASVLERQFSLLATMMIAHHNLEKDDLQKIP
jgi:hypothetical protein